jgi:hypothetical protein
MGDLRKSGTLWPNFSSKPRPTSIFRSAAVAVKNVLLAALGCRQEIAAVCAEDQGTNCGHFAGFGACSVSSREFMLFGTALDLETSAAAESFLDIETKNYSGACKQHFSADPTQDGKAQAMCSPNACETPAPKADWLHAGSPLWQHKAAGPSGSCLGTTSTTFSDILSTDTTDTTRHDTSERQPRARQRRIRDSNRKRICRMETPLTGSLLQLFGAIESGC